MSRSRVLMTVGAFAQLAWMSVGAFAHEIPDERVDRVAKVRLAPGRLILEYELSLSEFTVLLDLRRLEGTEVPGRGDQQVWDRYGRLVAPLNAAGWLLSVDGEPIEFHVDDVTWRVESHLIYTFRLSADLPPFGLLKLQDTNYLSSPGTGRLGVELLPEFGAIGPVPPPLADEAPARPRWLMSDEEEKATRFLQISYRTTPEARKAARPVLGNRQLRQRPTAPPNLLTPGRYLSWINLDGKTAWAVSWLLAVLLGAGHAVQPGHGKLVIATAAADGTSARWKAFGLAAIVASTHLASVVVLAALLWASREARYTQLDQMLRLVSGALLALLGFYRVGQFFSNTQDASNPAMAEKTSSARSSGWWMAGVAAGLIPCWDAVLLLLIAESEGKLPLGLWVLTGFSLGLLLVQFAVAEGSRRVGPALQRRGNAFSGRWLSLASGLVLGAIGLILVTR